MANVLVPLAQGCEELEAITIVDLLRRANINVVTASLDDKPVKASRGSVLIADTTIDQVRAGDFDMMVLPGGLPGADHLRDNARVQQLLKEIASHDKYIAAICAAPRALARAGLLNGKKGTSFPGSLDEATLSSMNYLDDPVVIDGKVITSKGPGTAMDFALTLIELLLGKQERDKVEVPLQRPAA
jgi:4-methyl-5(b-hydroxyethyl)-thiazole monophosphate biosynthesis